MACSSAATSVATRSGSASTASAPAASISASRDGSRVVPRTACTAPDQLPRQHLAAAPAADDQAAHKPRVSRPPAACPRTRRAPARRSLGQAAGAPACVGRVEQLIRSWSARYASRRRCCSRTSFATRSSRSAAVTSASPRARRRALCAASICSRSSASRLSRVSAISRADRRPTCSKPEPGIEPADEPHRNHDDRDGTEDDKRERVHRTRQVYPRVSPQETANRRNFHGRPRVLATVQKDLRQVGSRGIWAEGRSPSARERRQRTMRLRLAVLVCMLTAFGTIAAPSLASAAPRHNHHLTIGRDTESGARGRGSRDLRQAPGSRQRRSADQALPPHLRLQPGLHVRAERRPATRRASTSSPAPRASSSPTAAGSCGVPTGRTVGRSMSA